MYKRTAGLVLSGILATGAVGAVAMTPASATTSDNAVTSRLAGIKSALSGLVSDGTLTQSQADKVATTLDTKLPQRGHGHPGDRFGGMGLSKVHEAAAAALGLTTAQLHAAREGGKSLADVAKDQKVSVGSLVKAMVTAAQAQLATAVKDGTLTQAQADTMKSMLTQRITDHVNGTRPEGGNGRGHGRGHGHGLGQGLGQGPGQGLGQGPAGGGAPASTDGTLGAPASASSGSA